MVSADEHFERTMEDFRTLARTQSLVDDDLELMDFSEEDKVYVRLFVFSLFSSFFFSFSLRARSANDETKIIRAQRVNSSFFLVRLSLTRFYSFLPRSLARRHMEQKCPKAFIVPDKEKTQKRVTLYDLSTLLRVGENGGTKDRTTDMARKLNVTRTTFKELIEKIWGEQRMPNLSLVKNIQDGSAGFSDERLNEFGWAAAKASGVSLLAFFVALSPERRKVLEDENKKQRWSLNVKTGEMELVSIKTAHGRQQVNSENPKTGVTEEVSRTTAYWRQQVDWEDPETGVTEEVPRSTARGRQRVDWENPETGVTEVVPRTTARGRQRVDWEDPVTGVTEEVPRSTAYMR